MMRASVVLPVPGRAPQDDRLQQIALDRLAQRLARREELLLADELVEGARPHPLGQRRARGASAAASSGNSDSMRRSLQMTTSSRSDTLRHVSVMPSASASSRCRGAPS